MPRTVRKISAREGPPKLVRAAAYARVSLPKDAMLRSLAAQVSYYRQYIGNHSGWLFAGVYADEAVTGTKKERPEFQRLLADCRNGKIDLVITKSISRFARNTVALLETIRELKRLGVDVYFEEQNIHSASGDGELMLTILASYAQEESLSVSENCKWRIRERFEKGELIAHHMYGYRIERGKMAVHDEEAAVVRGIFSDYLSGLGATLIAKNSRP
jgi:DNA invertase Pin-like site-specific DNA recombinase